MLQGPLSLSWAPGPVSRRQVRGALSAGGDAAQRGSAAGLQLAACLLGGSHLGSMGGREGSSKGLHGQGIKVDGKDLSPGVTPQGERQDSSEGGKGPAAMTLDMMVGPQARAGGWNQRVLGGCWGSWPSVPRRGAKAKPSLWMEAAQGEGWRAWIWRGPGSLKAAQGPKGLAGCGTLSSGPPVWAEAPCSGPIRGTALGAQPSGMW